MNFITGALSIVELLLNRFSPARATPSEVRADPQVLEQLAAFQRQNAAMLEKYESLLAQMRSQEIESFEDLQRFDQKAAEALVKLARQTVALPFSGRNFGLFGVTSSGKSSLINALLGAPVAEIGACETTKSVREHRGEGFSLYDIPGRNDDLTYFTMEYIAFWKGLTSRWVVITSTVKEMTKVLRLLDAIELPYDIVVNKFDLVKSEEREEFKNQIRREIVACQLRGVRHLWFVSAQHPAHSPDWNEMHNSLTHD